MTPVQIFITGVVFGICTAGFISGLVACVAEWRAAAREGDRVAASFERAKRGGR